VGNLSVDAALVVSIPKRVFLPIERMLDGLEVRPTGIVLWNRAGDALGGLA
jgi:hypothetical protein